MGANVNKVIYRYCELPVPCGGIDTSDSPPGAWRNWAGGEQGLIAGNFFVTLTLANPFFLMPPGSDCNLCKSRVSYFMRIHNVLHTRC